jgi:hypothetical protein
MQAIEMSLARLAIIDGDDAPAVDAHGTSTLRVGKTHTLDKRF